MNFRITVLIASSCLMGLGLQAEEDFTQDGEQMPFGPPPAFTPPFPPEGPDSFFSEPGMGHQGPPKQSDWHPRMDKGSPNGEPMEVVERFLEMSPERLAMIRALIERIEQMTPEEKQAMREKMATYRALTEERRAHMMEEFKQVPVQDRLLLRMYWRSLPSDVARAEKEKLHAMEPEERKEYRQQLLDKARSAGITLAPPTPPPDMKVPPPPELVPPFFPQDGFRPPPLSAPPQNVQKQGSENDQTNVQ